MKYGLIGEHLSHSFSKEIHEQLADYKYELCEIARGDLGNFMQKREFCAINVTMPYKCEVIPYLDYISDEAAELQAVNVIVNRGGKLHGYNTDYLGMRDLILRANIFLNGKKVLVLGTGATSRTSALVCKNLGADKVIFVSRNKTDDAITYDEAKALHRDADVIVNATPVGMYPNSYSSPLDIEDFSNLCAVFDAVYNPLRTELTLNALGNKIHAESGLYMLVSQAVHAVELFLDTKIDECKIQEVFTNILKSKENIVLVGMPSSGKSTVGKILAEKLGRDFYDLDDEIEAKIGCTIAEYFEDHSERDFRDIETEVTKEISQKNGIIIATGGGCILRGENVSALRSNGRLYFLDRSLNSLIPTNSRPLASNRLAVENLYRLRYDIYKTLSDVRIDGDLAPELVSELIRKEFLK